MRYFTRGQSIASAERDATAERLLSDGWREVTRADYMFLWGIQDTRRIYQMRVAAYWERQRQEEQRRAQAQANTRAIGHIT